MHVHFHLLQINEMLEGQKKAAKEVLGLTGVDLQ